MRPLTAEEMQRYLARYMELHGITYQDHRPTMERHYYQAGRKIAWMQLRVLEEYGPLAEYRTLGGRGTPWVHEEGKL